MKEIKLAAIVMALLLAFAGRAFGQAHNRYDVECPSLQNATAPDLLQFLNGVTPDETNAWCVTSAIYKLGQERYEPAIPALVKLLDFQRPQTEQEKGGTTDLSSGMLFEAVEALEEIGKPALPAVLQAIEEESISAVARTNAVHVWVQIHGWPHKGIALLKQEEMKANDDALKQRLQGAMQEALKRCAPPVRGDEAADSESVACRQAAVDGVVR